MKVWRPTVPLHSQTGDQTQTHFSNPDIYFLSTSCGRNATIRYVLVHYMLSKARRGLTVLRALFLPVVQYVVAGFCSVKEKIVGNASGLRRLTVFVPIRSAFRSRSKHSGVKCSEQTRLCLDTGGSFKRNLTSHCFKGSGFLSGRVKKLTPRLMSMSLLQQPKATQCTICTCTEVTPPLLHVKQRAHDVII